ncbi:hypothetical protein [Burkholderia cenocepacia]|uniref:hypothetical protein n=1 Tax=Burkholderia cenocepacia TaxID=95486 RepID=UPI001F4BB2B2|nr:hypothetical protein [Burkholderia cenocepacia]
MTTENRRADALTYQEVEALAEKHGFAISAFDYTDSNSLVDLVNDAIRAASRDLQPAAAPIDWPHVANEWADAACNGVQWLKNVRDGISTPADALVEMESNIARIRALANIHQPAPSPADERAALPQIPDLVKATAWLTVCLRTELSRLDDNTDKALDEVEAQLSCVRAITNGAIDYEAMVDARAASANETGAEGATWYDRWQAECTRDHGEYDENAPISDRLRWWVPKSARHGTILLEDDLREAADDLSRSPAQADARVGLTTDMRESVEHAATWLARSEDLQNKAHAERLRALLQGANQ